MYTMDWTAKLHELWGITLTSRWVRRFLTTTPERGDNDLWECISRSIILPPRLRGTIAIVPKHSMSPMHAVAPCRWRGPIRASDFRQWLVTVWGSGDKGGVPEAAVGPVLNYNRLHRLDHRHTGQRPHSPSFFLDSLSIDYTAPVPIAFAPANYPYFTYPTYRWFCLLL